jgi:hypothetical protein
MWPRLGPGRVAESGSTDRGNSAKLPTTKRKQNVAESWRIGSSSGSSA